MIVLVDIDSTLNNFAKVLLKCNNKYYGTNYTYEDINSYEWFDQTFPDPWFFTEHPSFWRDVTINPEAVKAIEGWVYRSDSVFLVTASFFNAALSDKIMFTLDRFNPIYIGRHNIIITESKWAIKGDIMIDDCPYQLQNFEGTRVCYAQPWNKGCVAQYRTNDWTQICNIIDAHRCIYGK